MMHRWKKKGSKLLLVIAVCLALFPASIESSLTIQAADQTVVNGAQEVSGTLTGVDGKPTVLVKNGSTLTLNNATVNAAKGQSAIYVEGNATIVVKGTVTVNGGAGYVEESSNTSVSGGAGIEVPTGAAVTIKGSGTLKVTGGNASDGTAGILSSEVGAKDAGSIGKGGGGAGAGIGSRGASSAASTPGSGTITIDDDALRVHAIGGSGGNGGSGSDGGRYSQIRYDEKNISIAVLWYSTDVYATRQGGYGGNGGGGGGYPAAGIGSGGAAGGDGGAGGIPAQDYGEGTAIFNGFFYSVDEDVLLAGGGGGGGGQGFVSGGGGGAGESHVAEIYVRCGGGSVNEVYHANKKPLVTYGTGGSGGSGAKDPTDVPAFNGVSGTNAKGGTAGIGSTSAGNGGSAGIGQDSQRSASAGNNGKAAGNKGNGGTVNLSGGIVFAKAGDKGAQDIGSGGGNGTAKGTLRMSGGQLYVEDTKNVVQPVNERGAKVYGVTIYPSISKGLDDSKTTDVTINGSIQSMYFGDPSNGHLCVWLEESQDAYAISLSYPTKTDFLVTVKKNSAGEVQVHVDSTTVVVNRINLHNSTLVIWGRQWFTISTNSSQQYNRDVFGDEYAIFAYGYGNYTSKGNITDDTTFELYHDDPTQGVYPPIYEFNGYQGGVLLASDGGDYKFVIDRSTYIKDMYLGHANDLSGGTLTIESLGATTIGTMNMMNNNGMSVNFTGDANSSLTVESYAGTNWEWEEPSPITKTSNGKKPLFDKTTTLYPVSGAIYSGSSLAGRAGTNGNADLTMNSAGKVTIQTIVAGFKRGSGTFSGTPSIEVNKGRFAVGSTTFDQTYYTDGTTANEVRNMGNLTVTGGTFIKSGTAYTTAPVEFSDKVGSGQTTITPGASVLSEDIDLGTITGNKDKKEVVVTGLPANQHLTKIARSSNPNASLGDFENADIWTDAAGTYRTVLTNADIGKELIFEDADGNPHQYSVVNAKGDPAFTANTIAKMYHAFPQDAKADSHIDIYENFWVYDDRVYEFEYATSGLRIINAYTGKGDSVSGYKAISIPDITLHDQVDIIIDTTFSGAGSAFVAGSDQTIDGEGSLTLRGSGIVTEGINIQTDAVFFYSGVYTLETLDSNHVTMKYASVKRKDGQPIVGAVDENGNAVYQAKISTTNPQALKVYRNETSDGCFVNINAKHANDNDYYAFLPKDADYLIDGDLVYLSTFDEAQQTIALKAAKDVNTSKPWLRGLDEGTLEILYYPMDSSARLMYYFYGDTFYVKDDYDDRYDNWFEIGTSDSYGVTSENRILVHTKEPVKLYLRNLTMTTDLSCIELCEGANVTLILEGNNTLTSTQEAAIRVPESATLKIEAYERKDMPINGTLTARGGEYAAAIGGNQNEAAGTIEFASGTFHLTGVNNVAVGSGDGAATMEKSIKVADPSSVHVSNTNGGNGFGTAILNDAGDTLTRVILPAGSASASIGDTKIDIMHDGSTNYVYVPTVDSTASPAPASITVDGESYLLQPVNVQDSENGKITIYQVVNDQLVPVQNDDLILEGSELSVSLTPNDGYGYLSGLSDGTYTVKKDDGTLYLSSNRTFSNQLVLDDAWQPNSISSLQTIPTSRMSNTRANNDTLQSMCLELDDGETNTLQVASNLQSGKAFATLTAAGSGIRAQLLVNDEVIEEWQLDGTQRTYTKQWDSKEGDIVKIRFSGAGTIVVTGVMAANELPLSRLYTVFDKTKTIRWGAVDDLNEEGDNLLFVVSLVNADGTLLTDLNANESGIQVLENAEVHISFRDNNSNSVLDAYTLNWADGSVEKRTEITEPIIVSQDLTIDIESHQIPSYTVTIPKSVTLADEEMDVAVRASDFRWVPETAHVDVTIRGLDADGNVILTREGDTNTLKAAVKVGERMVKDLDLVARFGSNASTLSGGTITFGEPLGEKKAGSYTGKLTFQLSYDDGGAAMEEEEQE